MRQASPQLIALLDADQFIMADLYTITTIQGIEYRYTSYDVNLNVQERSFELMAQSSAGMELAFL